MQFKSKGIKMRKRSYEPEAEATRLANEYQISNRVNVHFKSPLTFCKCRTNLISVSKMKTSGTRRVAFPPSSINITCRAVISRSKWQILNLSKLKKWVISSHRKRWESCIHERNRTSVTRRDYLSEKYYNIKLISHSIDQAMKRLWRSRKQIQTSSMN